MACLFYSELRLGLASVGGSDVDGMVAGDLHCGIQERTGFTTVVLGLEGER